MSNTEAHNTQIEPRNASARAVRHESKTQIPPDDPTIRIIFHGLMCFTFDGTRECNVGIHNTTRGLPRPHDHPHDFNIQVWTINGSCPRVPMRIPIGDPKIIDGVRLDVVNPLLLNGVYTYQHEPFNRLNPRISDPEDWRWIVDLESEYLYPGGIQFRPDTINPSVAINNGLFYTLHKTTSDFAFRPDDNSPDHLVGNVAEIMACNIYLGPASIASLSILSIPFVFPMFGGTSTRYQIDVTNNCRKDGRPCSFRPGSDNPRERNDFYLYYETFDFPSGSPKFDLLLKESREAPGEPVICSEKSGSKTIKSSNDSPCGPIYGGGS